MNKGIVILCMKNAHYACAAFNLANSIKYHSPDIHITLLSDGIHNKAFSAIHFSQFDSIKEISEKTVTEAKLSINKYSDYDCTLYVDADKAVFKNCKFLSSKFLFLFKIFKFINSRLKSA